MRVIKFDLVKDWNTIVNDTFIEPLWIEWQYEGFVLWCKEYSVLKQDAPLQVFLAFTGEQVQDSWHYIGTATNPERTLVVHAFKS
jgi:hypothetical protein